MNIHDNVKIVALLLICLNPNVQPIYPFTGALTVPSYMPRPGVLYKKRGTEINHILNLAGVFRLMN